MVDDALIANSFLSLQVEQERRNVGSILSQRGAVDYLPLGADTRCRRRVVKLVNDYLLKKIKNVAHSIIFRQLGKELRRVVPGSQGLPGHGFTLNPATCTIALFGKNQRVIGREI